MNWVFGARTDGVDEIVVLMGPKGEQAAFSVCKDSVRGEVVRKFRECSKSMLAAPPAERATHAAGIPMLLRCPECGKRHIDVNEFATKVHHTHACQFCGMVWRPAVVATVGVEFLPGFKNAT